MSFQNRLAYYQDKRNSHLGRNNARLAGIYSDVILVDSYKNSLYDTQQIVIRDVDFVPIIFPYKSLNDTEIRQVTNTDGKLISHLTTVSKELFSIYVSSNKVVNVNDLLFWVVEDYSYDGNPDVNQDSVLLLLKVKGLKAKFGSYGIVFKTIECSVESPSTLPTEAIDLLVEAHNIRKAEFLASHNRVQQEP